MPKEVLDVAGEVGQRVMALVPVAVILLMLFDGWVKAIGLWYLRLATAGIAAFFTLLCLAVAVLPVNPGYDMTGRFYVTTAIGIIAITLWYVAKFLWTVRTDNKTQN
ncbi:hypothetical protein HY045_03540 [Candidatus Woesebacteria bacterium]|nr:hypothetical protein [Candidatus Woesebacteria bacterium]